MIEPATTVVAVVSGSVVIRSVVISVVSSTVVDGSSAKFMYYVSVPTTLIDTSTLCPKKVVQQTMGITLSILNGFSNFFHCW